MSQIPMLKAKDLSTPRNRDLSTPRNRDRDVLGKGKSVLGRRERYIEK
jgi:hypothetical protein